MTRHDRGRFLVLTRLVAGELDIAEAATALGLGERQVWRLKAAVLRGGPAVLVHGNRGQPSSPQAATPPVAARPHALGRAIGPDGRIAS